MGADREARFVAATMNKACQPLEAEYFAELCILERPPTLCELWTLAELCQANPGNLEALRKCQPRAFDWFGTVYREHLSLSP
jgi:hypothetical protein